MSARLPCGNQMFPTIGDNGVIKILIGKYEIPIEIPYKERFEYDNRTCIDHANILCYLENEEHKIVVRQDGSLTRYNKDNIVVGNIHINIPEEVFQVKVLPKGMLKVLGNSTLNANYLMPNKLIVLSTPTDEGFYEIPSQFNKKYIEGLESSIVFEPLVTIIGNELYICDMDNNPIVPLFSEYIPFVRGKSIR